MKQKSSQSCDYGTGWVRRVFKNCVSALLGFAKVSAGC